ARPNCDSVRNHEAGRGRRCGRTPWRLAAEPVAAAWTWQRTGYCPGRRPAPDIPSTTLNDFSFRSPVTPDGRSSAGNAPTRQTQGDGGEQVPSPATGPVRRAPGTPRACSHEKPARHSDFRPATSLQVAPTI